MAHGSREMAHIVAWDDTRNVSRPAAIMPIITGALCAYHSYGVFIHVSYNFKFSHHGRPRPREDAGLEDAATSNQVDVHAHMIAWHKGSPMRRSTP